AKCGKASFRCTGNDMSQRILQTAFFVCPPPSRITMRQSAGRNPPRTPPSAGRPARREGPQVKKIYVGNISFETTEDDLRQEFGKHGTVTAASVVTDRETGRSRGFAFVEMSDGGDAAIAALNGAMVKGRTLTVNEAKPREDRGGGGGRGGYGGGGGRGGGGGYCGGPRPSTPRGAFSGPAPPPRALFLPPPPAVGRPPALSPA